MNVALIYIDELPLANNNKFKLDFSTDDSTQKINFNKKNINIFIYHYMKKYYYISSLNCNLSLKDEIKKDKKMELKNFL